MKITNARDFIACLKEEFARNSAEMHSEWKRTKDDSLPEKIRDYDARIHILERLMKAVSHTAMINSEQATFFGEEILGILSPDEVALYKKTLGMDKAFHKVKLDLSAFDIIKIASWMQKSYPPSSTT